MSNDDIQSNEDTVLWVLKALDERRKTTDKNGTVYFEIRGGVLNPTETRQCEVIDHLVNDGTVIIKERRPVFRNKETSKGDVLQMKTGGYILKVLPKFDEIFEKYKNRNTDVQNELDDRTDTNKYYVVKKNDDFYYKGSYLNISSKTDYYKVFDALYAKLPTGGDIEYKELIREIRSRLKRVQNMEGGEVRRIILRNLTDRSSGFIRNAKIHETEDNGKPLLSTNRGIGITFNNRRG